MNGLLTEHPRIGAGGHGATNGSNHRSRSDAQGYCQHTSRELEVVLKKAHEAAEGSTRHGFKQKRLIVASALHCCSRSLGVPNVVIALSPGAHYLQTRIVRPTGGHGVEGERDRETESERKTRGIACCTKEQLRWLWTAPSPDTSHIGWTAEITVSAA